MKSMVRVLMFAILLASPWGMATAQESDELKSPADLTNATDKFTVNEVPVPACLELRFFDSLEGVYGVFLLDLKLSTLTFPYRVVEGTIGGDICGRRDWRVLPLVSTVGDTLVIHADNPATSLASNCLTDHIDITGSANAQPPGWSGVFNFIAGDTPTLPIFDHQTLFLGYTECPRRPRR